MPSNGFERPVRSCTLNSKGAAKNSCSSQGSTNSNISTQSASIPGKLNSHNARQWFGDIIGEKYRDPGTKDESFRDRGVFECTKIAVSHNKPIVYRRPVGNSRSSFEEQSAIDLRDVLMYMEPDVCQPLREAKQFSLKRVMEVFQKVMDIRKTRRNSASK